MRILIAARHPPGGRRAIGGVQSWCATVGAELQRLGHDIAFWGPGENLPGLFDAGIFANIGDTRPAMRLCRRHISICHGIIQPEQPPVRDVAFTSEEVRDFWHGSGPIIRQPIDLDFWLQQPCKKHLLVRFSYRDGLPVAGVVAAAMGLPLVHVRHASPEQARETLNQAICVLATGRAAVEAMACGVPVVICDERDYQGPLLDVDTIGSMSRNYSGRGGVAPDAQNLQQAIERAVKQGSLRGHVDQHHDARQIVQQLLCYIC